MTLTIAIVLTAVGSYVGGWILGRAHGYDEEMRRQRRNREERNSQLPPWRP